MSNPKRDMVTSGYVTYWVLLYFFTQSCIYRALLGLAFAFCILHSAFVFAAPVVPYSVSPHPYSVLCTVGTGSVFFIRIRIPYLQLWGQLRIPYPYPYSALAGFGASGPTTLGPDPYSVSVSVFRIYGFGT
jgi:hypothetical protein